MVILAISIRKSNDKILKWTEIVSPFHFNFEIITAPNHPYFIAAAHTQYKYFFKIKKWRSPRISVSELCKVSLFLFNS